MDEPRNRQGRQALMVTITAPGKKRILVSVTKVTADGRRVFLEEFDITDFNARESGSQHGLTGEWVELIDGIKNRVEEEG